VPLQGEDCEEARHAASATVSRTDNSQPMNERGSVPLRARPAAPLSAGPEIRAGRGDQRSLLEFEGPLWESSYAFSSFTRRSRMTSLKRFASPRALPTTLTAEAGTGCWLVLAGVGPKNMQKAFPVGQ
jgi:hypothetical protein